MALNFVQFIRPRGGLTVEGKQLFIPSENKHSGVQYQ